MIAKSLVLGLGLGLAGTASGGASDLDGVFHGFGTGGEATATTRRAARPASLPLKAGR